MTVLHILVGAVEVVHGPGVLWLSIQKVDAEGHEGFLAAREAHHRGQDVGLLGNLRLYLTFDTRSVRRLIYNNR